MTDNQQSGIIASMNQEGEDRPSTGHFYRIPRRETFEPPVEALVQGERNLPALQRRIQDITRPYYEALHRAVFDTQGESRRRSRLSFPGNRVVTLPEIPNNPSTFEVGFRRKDDEIFLEYLTGKLRRLPSEFADAVLKMDLRDAGVNSIALAVEHQFMGDKRAFLQYIKGRGALGRFALEFLNTREHETKTYGPELTLSLQDLPSVFIQVKNILEVPAAKSTFKYDPVADQFERELDPKTTDAYRIFGLSLRKEIPKEEYLEILRGALGLIPIEEDQ